MLKNMEQYANDLEGIVAKRTEDLAEEKKKTEELLHQMLPRLYSLEIKKNTDSSYFHIHVHVHFAIILARSHKV